MQVLILILCGLVGVFAHCVMKCNSLLTDARAANIDFRWKRDYLEKDALAILLSVLSVGIWYLIFAEVAASYPKLEAFTRTSFVFMGMLGSYVLQLVFSRAKKKIRAVVDAKTNIADGGSENTTQI